MLEQTQSRSTHCQYYYFWEQSTPNLFLKTGLFDYDKAEQAAGWIKELNNEHTPETEEYGITSFVFRQRRPFHPERFWNYVNHVPGLVVSSGVKGFFGWLPDLKVL